MIEKIMRVEAAIVGAAQDVAQTSARLAETVVSEAWSMLDAASEKKAPGEYLSDKAIQAIQGTS